MENPKKTVSQGKTSLNCGGKILSLEKPIVMGILNTTPDSFFDGGIHNQRTKALKQVEKMLKEGAHIIDIGGQSSKPGVDTIGPQEELNRILPILKDITQSFPEAILSIDSFHAEVAKTAIESGAHLINDISAGELDSDMIRTAAALKVPYIIMHKKGSSKTMQNNPQYENVLEEVFKYLMNKAIECHEAGIIDVIIDPGFGFGKTIEHNFTLLKHLSAFNLLKLPILVGISRKSMIHKVLNNSPKEALNGTTALHMVALQNGGKILRAHDVKEAMECIHLHQQLEGLS